MCSTADRLRDIKREIRAYVAREELYRACDINQSINARFVGRRYTTCPGAPTVVSYKHDQKVLPLSRFLNVLVTVMS